MAKTNSDIYKYVHEEYDTATKTIYKIPGKTAPIIIDDIQYYSEVGGNNDSDINYILTDEFSGACINNGRTDDMFVLVLRVLTSPAQQEYV